MSSQVNDIKPFKIKVQYLSNRTGLGHAIMALSKTFLPMNTKYIEHNSEDLMPSNVITHKELANCSAELLKRQSDG